MTEKITLTEPTITRFKTHFKQGLDAGECWDWQGTIDRGGYGRFRIGDATFAAHRIAWVIANGRTPRKGYVITHTCGNKACVNPEHLMEVTHQEAIRMHNSGDMHPKATVPNHIKKWAVDYVKENGLKSGALMRMIEDRGYKVSQSTAANWMANRFRTF